MAQGISLISGSPLIGCPIVYSVQPEDYAANRTFHRIIVRVYAKLETDSGYTTFDFSTPVETKPSGASYSTQPSQFDISSALRAVADKYEYTPEPPECYPYIKFRIEAWDEWMISGDIYPQQNVVAWPSLPVGNNQFYGYAFMGAFNDMERMNAQVDQNDVEYLDVTYLSRKPNTSPEIIFVGFPFVYPAAFNRGIGTTDFMTEGATPVFISGVADGTEGVAYRYDKTEQQTTVIAPQNSIVLLAYSNIGSDNALKIYQINQQTTNPSDINPIGSWEMRQANIGDAYINQADGHRYVALSDGWKDMGIDAPRSVIYTPAIDIGAVVGGHRTYGIKPLKGYEIRFVNGLGCVESVHVTSLVKKEVNIHTEKHTIARMETLKKFSRTLTVKTEDYETWTLSSGPLDEAWVSWYVHEFLASQAMWIKINSMWISCHVLPEETTTIRDTEKASMMSVQFRIQLDINGAI